MGAIAHRSVGNPCQKILSDGSICAQSSLMHNRQHAPDGDPCSCGARSRYHQTQNLNRPRKQTKEARRVSRKKYYATHDHVDYKYYVGIDGEGVGQPPNPHKYVLLAWSNNDGSKSDYVENEKGLATEQCLDFILSMPNNARPFSYGFNYDLTKILTDVDDKSLYKLFRPELRQRPPKSQMYGLIPVQWKNYSLNLQGTKFTIKKSNGRYSGFCKACKRSEVIDISNPDTSRETWICNKCNKEGIIKTKYDSKIVWDILKFFQGKFVNALKEWKVGDEARLDFMDKMKVKRPEFDKLDRDEIRKYCLDECLYMAQLAEKLTLAHEAVDLKLKTYYGAGSSASCILKKSGTIYKDDPKGGKIVTGIDKQERNALPEMNEAVSSAFFGGRFENSVIGEVPGPVWGYDISSAYPYIITFLPCLERSKHSHDGKTIHKGGTWIHTTNRRDIVDCTTAIVKYVLHPSDKQLVWGPFPFRLKSGSIAFPAESGGGWIYRDEYLAGEKLFDNIEFKEAWVYHTECDYQLFADIPKYYRERLRIGKEGPGIVIKLAVNATYGKLAQSQGNAPPFQSFIWAGMITSGTRGQLLDVLGLHKNRANCLMMATDGVYTRERFETINPDMIIIKNSDGSKTKVPYDFPYNGKMYTPRGTDTLTEHMKPLGGWEEKAVSKGLFLARPGIYFPMNPSEDELEQVRARGLGRSKIFEAWQKITQGYKEGKHSVKIDEVDRFIGAKSSISYGKVSGEYKRSPNYGQWIKRPIEMGFDPHPKRETINPDGTLEIRKFPRFIESMPYKKSVISPEALELKKATQEMLEQPDGDFSDFDSDEP